MKTNIGYLGHDYAHCDGLGCNVKENCIRYLLHKDAVKMGYNYLTYVIPDVKDGRCNAYWENEA